MAIDKTRQFTEMFQDRFVQMIKRDRRSNQAQENQNVQLVRAAVVL